MRRTKIVCTIGPASKSDDVLREMIMSGMDVARINFSHGDRTTQAAYISSVRRLAMEQGQTIAVLQDLQGPRVRIGPIKGGQAFLSPGQTVVLTVRPVAGDAREVSVLGADLSKDVRPGNRILIEDGLIELVVEEVHPGETACRVVVGGPLGAHKGINIPDVTISVPTITDKDRQDMAYGVKQGVDFVALSFVRTADDVKEARKLLTSLGSDAPIIAKIEKHEAISDIDSIVEAVDGVMVARGDLGVEIPLEQVPLVQKSIIHKCNLAGKPVITATQMLNSMIENPRPTRAEASDIANAILDGTDAAMLSGETAIGRYPVASVRTMAKIAVEAEQALPFAHLMQEPRPTPAASITDAISQATVEIAHELGARAIVTMTASGFTARMIAKYRPKTPILVATPNEKTRVRLALTWGVQSPLRKEYRNTDELIQSAVEVALGTGIAREGDSIVITAGVPIGVAGRTNFLKVHTVGEPITHSH
ncbi:MAG: pyruvate kinase [Chloroflexi bacterium]|nr:pyruvate kinase [Chloroflexota bacterium]